MSQYSLQPHLGPTVTAFRQLLMTLVAIGIVIDHVAPLAVRDLAFAKEAASSLAPNAMAALPRDSSPELTVPCLESRTPPALDLFFRGKTGESTSTPGVVKDSFSYLNQDFSKLAADSSALQSPFLQGQPGLFVFPLEVVRLQI